MSRMHRHYKAQSIGRRSILTGLASTAAAAVVHGRAGAQTGNYPSRPITIVNNSSAGGINDSITRMYAESVSRNLGQRFVIDNRPQGAGTVAASAVHRADPDGYTLLSFSGSQFSVIPALQPVPYDPIRGFKPITPLFSLANLLAVPTTSPANTLAELLEYGRKKPGGLSFGSSGFGTHSHLFAAWLSMLTKTPMEFVQYRGAAPLYPDLISGRIDFSVVAYSVAKPSLDAGQLKILAVDTEERWREFPNVPTLAESGIATKTKVPAWFGLSAPAGTPDAIVRRLNAEFLKVARDPATGQKLMERGVRVTTASPEEMQQMIVDAIETSAGLVKALNLRLPEN